MENSYAWSPFKSIISRCITYLTIAQVSLIILCRFSSLLIYDLYEFR